MHAARAAMHLHPLTLCLSLYQEQHHLEPMGQVYTKELEGHAECKASAALGKTGVLGQIVRTACDLGCNKGLLTLSKAYSD